MRWSINLASVNVCWFACILGAAAARPWLGPLAVAAHLALHLALAPRRGIEVVLVVVSGGLGYLADSALVLAGLLHFPEAAQLGGPSPVWMVALWLNFATALNLTLSGLKGRLATAALVGALGGPLSYFAGARLGAVELEGALALLAVGVEWLVALPLLLLLARRLTEVAP